jgi:hypothetical protein
MPEPIVELHHADAQAARPCAVCQAPTFTFARICDGDARDDVRLCDEHLTRANALAQRKARPA